MRSAIVGTLLLVALTSCIYRGDDFRQGIFVTNDIDRGVVLYVVENGNEQPNSRDYPDFVLRPGKRLGVDVPWEGETSCSQAEVIARDSVSGDIVARMVPPLCDYEEKLLSEWLAST